MRVSKSMSGRVLLLRPRFIRSASYFNFHPAAQTQTQTQTPAGVEGVVKFDSKLVTLSFKDWFRTGTDSLLDRIFEILATTTDDDLATELKLKELRLPLNEHFVLKVLNKGKDVLPCLKFFDWAGRQRGYNHTRATFCAIFKILARQKLMSLILDFLEAYTNQRRMHKVRFYDTLVIGYAVAGKPDIALKLFGRMRFQGIDLDPFAYHVFLNCLVEHKCFDVVEALFKQIQLRGLENDITYCIMVKNFCKQNKLDEAVDYVRSLMVRGHVINDSIVGVLVDAHCKKNNFETAHQLMVDFWGERTPLGKIYGIWTSGLVRGGKLDWALDFLRSKKFSEGYVPDVFRYNILICRLLTENRLDDVSDLLMEMMADKISPDKVTMNAALCFFCKAGMVEVALDLYYSRSEFGLTPNSFCYNYLINTLCGDGSVDEACQVLQDSIKQGYFPGKRTSSIIADALCSEGKLDKMKELIMMALKLNVVPDDTVCVKFISALCKARRVGDGYMIYNELNGKRRVTNKYTYFDLVHGFNMASRGDMAARLLIEMQENGHIPSRQLYRAVICCICTMDNPEIHFYKLLEMQLSRQEPSSFIYAFFIDGAGHAKRPDLARDVYQMMIRNGIEPSNAAKIYMLQSFLKNDYIANALKYYGDLCKKGTPGRRIYNTMVVGLSKANRPGLALEVLRDLRQRCVFPSLECYEELVRSFCSAQNYDMVVEVIDDLKETGRQVSSFMGNVLLWHSFRSRELYNAWVRSERVPREASSGSLTLGELIGLFSGGIRASTDIENLDELVKQCFPVDTFTYNMLLMRLSMTDRLDLFVMLVQKMRANGHELNKWTYDIVINCLCKKGMRNEAMKWVNEAHRMGFDLSEHTSRLL